MKNILIIDDEMDIRNNIKAILEDENYNTQTASDSSKAMKLIKENAENHISVIESKIKDLSSDLKVAEDNLSLNVGTKKYRNLYIL